MDRPYEPRGYSSRGSGGGGRGYDDRYEPRGGYSSSRYDDRSYGARYDDRDGGRGGGGGGYAIPMRGDDRPPRDDRRRYDDDRNRRYDDRDRYERRY